MRGSWAHSSGSLAFFISSRVTFISGASHGEHVRGRWRCACRANPNRARAWTRRDRSELLARRPKAVELRLGPRFQGVRRSILCHGRRGGVSSRGGEHARSDGGKNCNFNLVRNLSKRKKMRQKKQKSAKNNSLQKRPSTFVRRVLLRAGDALPHATMQMYLTVRMSAPLPPTPTPTPAPSPTPPDLLAALAATARLSCNASSTCSMCSSAPMLVPTLLLGPEDVPGTPLCVSRLMCSSHSARQLFCSFFLSFAASARDVSIARDVESM